MTVEIRVPVLGESVVSATVTRWLKQPGDTVMRDEPIAELETDKISIDVPAPCGGVLKTVSVAAGDDVQVGAILGHMEGQDGLSLSPRSQQAQNGTEKASTAHAAPPSHSESTGDAGRPPAGKAPLPAAEKMMKAHDVAAEAVDTGTGKDGRITKADVISHLDKTQGQISPAQSSNAVPQAASLPRAEAVSRPVEIDVTPVRDPVMGREERVPMSRLRQTIARRLKDAQNTAAILTTFNEIDMSVARDLRDTYRGTFEKKHGVKLGYMSFFARAVIKALETFPVLNAEIVGNDIIYRQDINLGIAVGSKRGLVVPVIRHANELGFAELERKIKDYGQRARDGNLKLHELAEGTFTITNGGVFGSLLSTPILNTPQSGILGMHVIQDRPIAVNGQVVIRPMMNVALSYDHRIVDGREAVSFLVRVKELVEDPHCLLLDI
ncbi:2-oxoglutarate dehydrogenase complex dihydrolipoyllysine-residue succinyltransferase [Candidatus Kirkpatrickella diaphorinae]|uniref:Dihydrolipoyllysine-residue succinyltransferase component of 2-oxoglutarate dehydrogenase complex n=1 Tax=Candidatus Kirkpatrickella diaphorinae TaxID=2984322 RepID=A0ABY6GI34_9PROT|nr:2-oxoglutarate dehydrogenase complex dihydrolipoyllysine-residue succinyltransferase [Candidatus Kirkpatrickella diaphorinae]UYH50924.1 2-oxoglutarate dehydrogenase complex dihydrolipoyllysine-residue succinyltransferase [Candidatus Kirkpatrickella diaphorinae]